MELQTQPRVFKRARFSINAADKIFKPLPEEEKASMDLVFHRFPDLPKEIQLQIWGHAINKADARWSGAEARMYSFLYCPYQHRHWVYALRGDRLGGYGGDVIKPIFAIMHACKLSRQLILGYWIKTMHKMQVKMKESELSTRTPLEYQDWAEDLMEWLEDLIEISGKP